MTPLEQYIQSNQAKGYSREDIRQKLLDSGYSQAQVSQAFDTVPPINNTSSESQEKKRTRWGLIGGLVLIFGIFVTPTLLGIIAFFTILSTNPQQQFASARDTQRRADMYALKNGVHQYALQNGGFFPISLNSDPKEIGTGEGRIDLESLLVPTYIKSMPYDPSTGTKSATNYYMYLNSSGWYVFEAESESQEGSKISTEGSGITFTTATIPDAIKKSLSENGFVDKEATMSMFLGPDQAKAASFDTEMKYQAELLLAAIERYSTIFEKYPWTNKDEVAGTEYLMMPDQWGTKEDAWIEVLRDSDEISDNTVRVNRETTNYLVFKPGGEPNPSLCFVPDYTPYVEEAVIDCKVGGANYVLERLSSSGLKLCNINSDGDNYYCLQR